MKTRLTALAAFLFPCSAGLAAPLFLAEPPPSIALFLSEPLRGPAAFDRTFRAFQRLYPRSRRSSIDTSMGFHGEVVLAEGYRIADASTITDYRNLTLNLATQPCLPIDIAAKLMAVEIPARWPPDEAPNMLVERNGMQVRVSAPHPRSRCVSTIVLREAAGPRGRRRAAGVAQRYPAR